jgi:hypothetical protein
LRALNPAVDSVFYLRYPEGEDALLKFIFLLKKESPSLYRALDFNASMNGAYDLV